MTSNTELLVSASLRCSACVGCNGSGLGAILGNARARQRSAPHTHGSEQGADGAEDAMALFGRAGSVAMVRICPPGSGPKSTAQLVWGADLAVSNQVCRALQPCTLLYTSYIGYAHSVELL